MQATRVAMGRGAVSNRHGQQRILKQKPDLLTYIQKSVKSGTYRTNEEIRDMNREMSENPTEERRIRWNVQRGSQIQDYPFEYEAMTLNPPMPFRPFVPVKDQRRMAKEYVKKHRPTDRLAEKYLKRLHERQASENGAAASSEEYYRKLLGADKVPRVDSAMGQKSAAVNKAYAFAIKQNEVMRMHGISEQDALDSVEDMLREDAAAERRNARTKASALQSKRRQLGRVATEETPTETAQRFFPDGKTSKPNDMTNVDYLSLLYSNDQRAFEGMISWTYRLQSVPYAEWTVGASTALDHWIAKKVLGMSEETWLSLLEGEDASLLGQGRDIVTARHALFPETVLDASLLDDEEEMDGDLNDADDTGGIATPSKPDVLEGKDIDSLLKALQDWHDPSEDSPAPAPEAPAYDEDQEREKKILDLTEELQEWRRVNMNSPYDQWQSQRKKKFDGWMAEYVTAISPDASLNDVDFDATRQSLLASPPQTKEDSDSFWNSIRDETAAEVLLNRLLENGPPDSATEDEKLFWDLPYDVQLKKLVSLGAIRELSDEYTKHTDRAKFVARYGNYLLEGVEMEHLIPDASGPILGSEVGERLARQLKVEKDERFRIEKIPFGSDEFGTDASKRARAIFKAWNKFKAGRAHYEEKLFHQDLLGLRYAKPSRTRKHKRVE